MATKRPHPEDIPIGERLRQQRVEVLNKGLREMAKLLKIAPAHLTDIEKGRRTPSDSLLKRISTAYDFPETELRTGWQRPDTIVSEIATQDAVTAEKVPEFLRTARKLSREQWDNLIRQARDMLPPKSGKPRKK